MKILYYGSGHVDLEAPINMTDEQFAIFIKFFIDNFPGVEFEYRTEKKRNIGPIDADPKEWTLDEYVVLVRPLSNSEIAAKLGRTEMSVKMKRGDFVPNFFAWMKKKGYTLPVDTNIILNYFSEMMEA